MLYDVTTTAVAATILADIAADVSDLMTGILRTDGTAHQAHHLQVRDIVAHKHHLVVLQAVLLLEILVDLDFHGSTQIDVLHAQALIAVAHGLYLTAADDGDAQSHLDGQLDGIAVLDIHGAQRCAVGSQRDGLCREHAVQVKHNGPYLL